MILSNSAIFEALDDGRLAIAPEPRPRYDAPGEASPYSTCSVDLTLSSLLNVPIPDMQVAADLRAGRRGAANTLAALTTPEEIHPAQGWKLEPGKFVLGQTAERVALRLPADMGEWPTGKPVLAARVEGRSSLARFGIIVHFTAPTIHAGFEGPITLEMMCHSETSFTLYRGMAICQLILEPLLGEPVEVPAERRSQFQHQDRPTGERG